MEEAAEEVSPTGNRRMIRTHQEEYQEAHRPYPTPLINSLAYHRKYSRGTGPRQKTSFYSGARTAGPTETIQRWQYHSQRP